MKVFVRGIFPLRAQKAIAIVVSPLFVLCAGCTSSRLTDERRDPSFQTPPIRNILVVCMKKNAVRRRLWEDGFVAELSAHGVRSTPSYQLFADGVPDTDQMNAAIEDKAYDGVLLVTKRQTATSTRYVPGDTRTVAATLFNRLTKSYYTVYRQVQDSGYC